MAAGRWHRPRRSSPLNIFDYLEGGRGRTDAEDVRLHGVDIVAEDLRRQETVGPPLPGVYVLVGLLVQFHSEAKITYSDMLERGLGKGEGEITRPMSRRQFLAARSRWMTLNETHSEGLCRCLAGAHP